MIIHADCILAMAEMEPSSIDAIVTDPPYGLEFMGKEWDAPHKSWDKRGSGALKGYGSIQTEGKPHALPPSTLASAGASFQLWTQSWASEALRVLKPGGSLLSFGGTRTFHRLTCGLEDAGFIIKDCLMWLYGQGFPKAQDLGKMIDKRLGAEREVVGSKLGQPGYADTEHTGRMLPCSDGAGEGYLDITAPASDLARHWDGYKIGGIKPAWEPIIWAVKPPEGAWIDNVLTFGTGAVNVDECRVGTEPVATLPTCRHNNPIYAQDEWTKNNVIGEYKVNKGRFPANLLLDESAAALLDEQSGVSRGSTTTKVGKVYGEEKGVSYLERKPHGINIDDTGGASRFFYTSKATDRDDYNDHPTLKPTDLIEWLIRLVTRPGQLVLDPFAGSGTTGVAAIQSGREFILIEQDEHYVDIAEKRTSEGVQTGMF